MVSERTKEILRRLDGAYGTDLSSFLHYGKDYELLFAVILSAQCTDERVNLVTDDLFARYDTLEKFASADIEEMEQAIRSIGFYHGKAKHLISCARMLLCSFGGVVPDSMEDLTTLPGVGRKSANVILGQLYHQPSVAVDTHVGRISRRLSLTKETDPVKVEADLRRRLPKDHWILWNQQIIRFGRTICTARSPHCESCFLYDLCRAEDKKEHG